MSTVFLNGKQYDLDAVINLMDDEIREELHTTKSWKTKKEFLDAYMEAHFAKYGEEFVVN